MALATGFIGIPELMEYQLFRAQQWLSVRPITAPLGLPSHRTLKLNQLIFLPSATASQATCRGHDRDAQVAGRMRREPGPSLSISCCLETVS